MKKIFEVKYVNVGVNESEKNFKVKMPFGEMNQHQVKGLDGGPDRIENSVIPFLKNLKHCHTNQRKYEDDRINFEYKNLYGTWADFVFEG
jgi:hypothetical protein